MPMAAALLLCGTNAAHASSEDGGDQLEINLPGYSLTPCAAYLPDGISTCARMRVHVGTK